MPRSFDYPIHKPYPGSLVQLTITGRLNNGKEYVMTLELLKTLFRLTMADAYKGEIPMMAAVDMFGAIEWLGNTLHHAMQRADELSRVMDPKEIDALVALLMEEEARGEK